MVLPPVVIGVRVDSRRKEKAMHFKGRLPRFRYIAQLFILVALFGLIIGARTTTTSAATMGVTIQNFAYAPASISVPVGTTISWTNRDSTAHTVTSNSGAFDSGIMNAGASYSFTFNQAGTFAYHCEIHPFMVASITVTGSAAAAPAAPTAARAPVANTGGAAPTRASAPSSGGTTAPVLPTTGQPRSTAHTEVMLALSAAIAVIVVGMTLRLRGRRRIGETRAKG